MDTKEAKNLFFNKCKMFFKNSNLKLKFQYQIDYLNSNLKEDNIENEICFEIYMKSFECFIDYFNNYYSKNTLSYDIQWKEYIEQTDFNLIFRKYLNLKRDIYIRIQELLNEKVKIIKRYDKDHFKIFNKFKHDFGSILSIELNMGDIHNGKSVAKIKFSNGILIYKPQKYNQYIILKSLLCFLNTKLKEKISINIPQVFYNDKYSWVEYIDNDKLNLNNVNKFFYEVGVYLSVFYVLGTTDLHMENMLIHNNHPVFIDLETLITYKHNINNSILSSGLLPLRTNESLDIIISSIFRPSEEISRKMSYSKLYFDNNNGFQYIKEHIELHNESYNSKILFGNKMNLIKLIDGFEISLKIIILNKMFILNKINNLFKNNNFYFRVVLKNSEVYGEFLDGIMNPNTRLNNERDKILELFLQNKNLNISKDEIKNIKNGWIPSYYISSKNNYLLNSNYELIDQNYFNKNPFKIIKNNFDRLNYSDLFFQKQLIKLSYLKTHLFNYTKNNSLDKNILNILNYFTSRIYKNYFMNSTSNIFYYSLNLLKNNFVDYGGIYPGIYNTSGWCLLLYYYGIKFDCLEYVNVSLKLLEILVKMFNKNNSLDESLLTGNLGTYYAYMYITKNEKVNFSINTNILNKFDNKYKNLIYCINNSDENTLLKLLFDQLNSDNNKLKNFVYCKESMSPYLSGAIKIFASSFNHRKED